MAEALGRDLAFETFAILLREGDELVVRGMSGMPFFEDRIPLGQGVTGMVAMTGTPLVVPDVRDFPGYIVADPSMRSEMAAPLRIGEEVIGVIDVESRQPAAFDDGAVSLLNRLADQVALVIHGAHLRAQQRETLERLRELDQMKSDFVAIASHELRTPLTAIHGYVRTLVRRFDDLSTEHIHTPQTTVREQAEIISGRLRRSGRATFRGLVADCAGTYEVVARFLALLDLYRDAAVSFEQLAALGELYITWTGKEGGE